jgi:hypothetical protein
VKMRSVMGCSRFSVHTNDDPKEPSNFRHTRLSQA